MTWTKIIIDVAEKDKEWLVAELVDRGVEAFEEEDERLILWLADSMDMDPFALFLESLLKEDRIRSWSRESVEDQNWNRTWEESIEPQEIGPFFIHPTWSRAAVPESRTPLAIDPKMAFGTGYHATTHLILQWLPEVAGEEVKRMLDAGTGTGILAIAALKLGAGRATGFDLDPWSVENAIENRVLNGVEDRFNVLEGDLSVVPEDQEYELIVANINRNVLLGMVSELTQRLKPNGVLLLSGLLDRDEEAMRGALADLDVVVREVRQRQEWIAMRVERAQG